MKQSSSHLIGIVCLLFAVLLFSTIEVASKKLHGSVPPMALTSLRFLFTGIFLLLLSLPRLVRKKYRLSWEDAKVFLLNGSVGIALAISLFHLAISVLDKASSAAVVFSINPVFVILLSPIINKDRLCYKRFSAALLAAVGVGCFAWESGEFSVHSLKGMGLMLLAALFFAISICISKRVMHRFGAIFLMGGSALVGSMILIPISLFFVSWQNLSGAIGNNWAILFYIIVFGTSIPYVLYYLGIHKSSVQEGSMSFFLKPVIAGVLAYYLCNESFNIFMVVGTVLILLALCFAVILPMIRGKQK